MRTLLLVLVVAATACTDDATPDLGSSSADVTVRRGIDYAWGRPPIAALRGDGYAFAARYVSSDPSKNLSAAEASALRGAGIDVVVVWEDAAEASLDGYSRGVSDAHAAAAQAAACGEPSSRPIYFAVDFDASAGQEATIADYFDGVASVLGRDRTGAYAGYDVLQHLFDAGKIDYGWQTESWSDGRWEPRAQLRQVSYDVSVAGVSSDIDDAVAADYGQWGYAQHAIDGLHLGVARNADGRLEVFYTDGSTALEHTYERESGGWTGWTAPAALGGRAKSLVVARNADGRLELFYVGTNDRIYHNWQDAPNAGWHGEEALDGAAKQLAVALHGDGRIELFYIGTNDALYHDWQLRGGGWSGEHGLGGKAKQLAAATNADGRIEVVYVGTNDALYHNWQTAPDAGWHGQAAFGGKAKQVAIAPNADGRLDVLYIGTDDALYHDYQQQLGSHWSGEKSLGGKAKQIAVDADADGHLELFYIGTDDALYHDWQDGPNGSFVGQHALGGKADELAVARNADGRLELFYIGTNGALYHNWQKASDAPFTGQARL
ncbi:MAG TPA: glycoside hydrolase domain-containing protein [Kofleriaceae bacterium]|nr:glycoside hydrolase domain-containing protein [Kofleriaceae bacterium]